MLFYIQVSIYLPRLVLTIMELTDDANESGIWTYPIAW